MAVANSLSKIKGYKSLSNGYFEAECPDDILEREGFNPRNYHRADVIQHIRTLADAYIRGEDLGAWEVKVIDGKVYMVEGHCRRKARNLAISEGYSIPRIIIKEAKGDENEADFRVLSSQNGLKLSPIERGIMYRRLRNRGVKLSEIAIREGITEVAIRNCLAVFDLPVEMKNAIEDGIIAMTLALELYQEYGTGAVSMIKSAVQIRSEEESKAEERMRAGAALGDLFDALEADSEESLNNGGQDSIKSNVIPFARDESTGPQVTKPVNKTAPKHAPKPAPVKLTRKDLIKKPKKRSNEEIELAFQLLKEVSKAAKSAMQELAQDDESMPFMDDTLAIKLESSMLNDLFKLINK